jgi:hypothetical protein
MEGHGGRGEYCVKLTTPKQRSGRVRSTMGQTNRETGRFASEVNRESRMRENLTYGIDEGLRETCLRGKAPAAYSTGPFILDPFFWARAAKIKGYADAFLFAIGNCLLLVIILFLLLSF